MGNTCVSAYIAHFYTVSSFLSCNLSFVFESSLYTKYAKLSNANFPSQWKPSNCHIRLKRLRAEMADITQIKTKILWVTTFCTNELMCSGFSMCVTLLFLFYCILHVCAHPYKKLLS